MCSHPCKSFCNTKVPELLLLLFPFFIYIKVVQKHINPTFEQSSVSIKSIHQNSNHTSPLYYKQDFKMSDNNNTQQSKQGGGGFFGGITNAAGGLASGVGGVASGMPLLSSCLPLNHPPILHVSSEALSGEMKANT